MKRILFIVLLAGSFFALTFCKHAPDLSIEPPFPKPRPEVVCSQDTIFFQNSVFPIIYNSCAKSGCHDAATHKHGIELTDYGKIMDLVTPGQPDQSQLYKVLFSGGERRMPPNEPLAADSMSLIYYWVKQGALNNLCTSPCDTISTITYSGSIQPLIKSRCGVCHEGSNPQGNVSLATYDQVKAYGLNGKLLGSVRHDNGYYAMPKNASPLSECEIAEIKIWIDSNYRQK